MLEEALNNDKHPPAETALAMLSFVQELPAGGSLAEARFFGLYGPLCERIFGPIQGADKEYRHAEGGWLSAAKPWRTSAATTSSVSSLRAVGGGSNTVRPTNPASMSATSAATTRFTAGRSSRSGRSTSNAMDSDPVVILLQTSSNRQQPSLLEAISRTAENSPSAGFPLAFFALPTTAQTAWLSAMEETLLRGTTGTTATPVVQYPMDGRTPTTLVAVPPAHVLSANDRRLFCSLLKTGPMEQRELILYKQKLAASQQRQQPLQLSPTTGTSGRGGFHNPTLNHHFFPLQSPITPVMSPAVNKYKSPTPFQNGSNQTRSMMDGQAAASSPNVMLSMIEYYLFVFLRFPLATPTSKKTQTDSSTAATLVPSVRVSRREPYGQLVYHSLFRKYLQHFLRYGNSEQALFGNMNGTTDSRWPQQDPLLVRTITESELFLRIIILLWLETQAVVKPTDQVVSRFLQEEQRSTIIATRAASQMVGLQLSYDLVQGEYHPAPHTVQKGLQSLIVHVLLDPALTDMVQTATRERDLDDNIGNATTRQQWCLPQSMTELQQPFYNYVRTAFRYASIHASDSPFFAALDVWLIWLEPWNVIVRKSSANTTKRFIGTVAGASARVRTTLSSQRAISAAKYNTRSSYNPGWEPFIASNLHMYTVPLSIFLRRARELDFSANKFDRSVQLVNRVFRVFTPEVVDAISRHLDASAAAKFLPLVSRHVELLEPFAPPLATAQAETTSQRLSLSSCQGDMQSLLEEIHMQHIKRIRELDIFERLFAKIEGLFGQGVVSGEERTVETLVERARIIVLLPADYEFFPKSSSVLYPTSSKAADKERAASSVPTDDVNYNLSAPDRSPDGKLTNLGKQQIECGWVKCNPADVPAGDPLRARVASYELAVLVQVAIVLSDWLNRKFGFDPNVTADYKRGVFRFNLRFLADYRNLLWLGIILGWLLC